MWSSFHIRWFCPNSCKNVSEVKSTYTTNFSTWSQKAWNGTSNPKSIWSIISESLANVVRTLISPLDNVLASLIECSEFFDFDFKRSRIFLNFAEKFVGIDFENWTHISAIAWKRSRLNLDIIGERPYCEKTILLGAGRVSSARLSQNPVRDLKNIG